MDRRFPQHLRSSPYRTIPVDTVLGTRDDAILVKDRDDHSYCIVKDPVPIGNGRAVKGLIGGTFLDVNRALERFNDGT